MNFALTGLGIIVRLLSATILIIILARSWGAERFGLFSFVLSITLITSVIVDFGLNSYLLRELNNTSTNRGVILAGAFRLKLLLVLPYLAVLLAAATVSGTKAIPPWLLVPLAIQALLNSFAEFFISFLRAQSKYRRESLVSIVGGLLQLALPIFALEGGLDEQGVVWCMAGARALYLTLAVLLAAAAIAELQFESTKHSIRFAVMGSRWFALETGLASAWNNVDVILARIFLGEGGAGLYAAAQRIVQASVALAPIVGNVMIPRATRKWTKNEAAAVHDLKLIAIAMAGLGVVLSSMIYLSGNPKFGVTLLFGPEYAPLNSAMPYFAAVVLIRFLAAAPGTCLTCMGMQSKRSAMFVFSMAIFTLAIFAQAYLGPLDTYSIAIAYGIGYFASLIVQGMLVRKALSTYTGKSRR